MAGAPESRIGANSSTFLPASAATPPPRSQGRRRLGSDDDGLQRGRQLFGNFLKLAELFGIDETEPRGGIAKKIEKLACPIEIGYHRRNDADADGAEPHCHIVEAVGAEQQDA